MATKKSVEQLSLSEIEVELQARLGAVREEARPLAEHSTKQLVDRLLAEQKVIYGVDDRKDFYEFPNDAIRNSAATVAGLFDAAAVTDNDDGTCTLRTEKFGTRYNLCSSERFRDQPIGAFCSGFLVASDIIATAGHCVDERNVTGVRFVFGFRMADKNTAVLKVPTSEVYSGRTLLGRVEEGHGADWALVRLDRRVANHPIARIRRTGRIVDGAKVYVIGHPSGLPIKFADGAAVRDNTPSAFFVANLDTYGGNSGSPVFGQDHVVEGILVRGEADFVSNGNCNVSKVCPTTGCRGEDCTRATLFAHLVPSVVG